MMKRQEIDITKQLDSLQEELRIAKEQLLRRDEEMRSITEDIDKLKLTAQAELQALEKRFDFALESAGMSWWDWNIGLDRFEVRNGNSCILGESFCDWHQGREGWMALVHDDDREMVLSTLNAHLCGETEQWVCEHRFRKMDNEWVWVSNRGMVTQRDSSGKALYMMGNTLEIDAFKKALIEATYQRDMLAAAGKIASMGSWEYSVETNRVVWSDQIREIMEVDADFDPNLEDSFEFFPAQDRARLEAAFKLLIEHGTPYDLDLRCISRQGRRMFTMASGRPQFDLRGKIVGAVGVFQDITGAQFREHERQAFFALSPDFQATVDFNGTFLSCSPSWQAELGYPDGFLTGKPVADIVLPEHRFDFLKSFSSVINGSVISNYDTLVYNYVDYLGGYETISDLWLSWSFSSDPDLKLVFVSARCVTEQRQTNQRLIDERIRAEQANHAKSEFLAVMSHELRTPLNPILGFSELLLSEIQDSEHQQILKTIVDSGQHLIQLIDEVLDYSKLEAHKTEIELSDFSLEEFVLDKIRLMRGQLKDKDVVLKHSLVAGPFHGRALPIFVADVSILTQIVRNLLSNALKFTSVGEVCLTVTVESVENSVAILCFSVSDTGIGIAPEDHGRIFEAFTQADTSNTRQYGGTGLGLAICKQLSDLLGGRLTVKSALGEGATFALHVPLSYIENCEETVVSLADSHRPTDVSLERSETPVSSEVEKQLPEVLIVEDNETNQFYLHTVLKRQGCLPIIVEDGESALAQIEKDLSRFKWTFLDLHMPGMGGLAALEKIREMEREASAQPSTIIVMTADAENAVRLECFEKGANEFLIKPAPVQEVLALLDQYSVTS